MQTQLPITVMATILRMFAFRRTVYVYLVIVPLSLQFRSASGQRSARQLISIMTESYDQFDKKFDSNDIDDILTVIYIPGSNDPFGKVYDKYKGKSLAKNTLFIGGFKEMIMGMSEEKKKGHLQDALEARFGKEFRILLDLESEVGEHLSLEGYTIIILSKQDDKITQLRDFGFDRVEFIKALQPYILDKSQ